MEIIDIPSKNGPEKLRPNQIIVHSMAEFIEGGERDIYCVDYLERIGLSAHAFITPSGSIIRCREDNQGAYHAKGRNTIALGVEFMVPGVHTYSSFMETIDNKKWVSDAQFNTGVQLIRQWITKHEIAPVNIFQHSEIDPFRKHDPGKAFPFDKFMDDVFDGIPF